MAKNKFMGKNLGILTPLNIAMMLLLLAGLQLFGVSNAFSNALFAWQSLTVTVGVLLMVILAVGILYDSRK